MSFDMPLKSCVISIAMILNLYGYAHANENSKAILGDWRCTADNGDVYRMNFSDNGEYRWLYQYSHWNEPYYIQNGIKHTLKRRTHSGIFLEAGNWVLNDKNRLFLRNGYAQLQNYLVDGIEKPQSSATEELQKKTGFVGSMSATAKSLGEDQLVLDETTICLREHF